MSYLPNVQGKVSETNNTSTPLAASGVWVGTAEDVSKYSTVAISVYADVAGSGYVEFSTDNTNFTSGPTIPIPADSLESFIIPVTTQYIRVVYENGATPQTEFRLQTVFGSGKPPIQSPIAQPIDQTAIGQTVRSVLTGAELSGQYKNVEVTTDNALRVDVTTPASSFGQVSVEQPTPQFQHDFTYTINPRIADDSNSYGNGTVTVSGALAEINSGGGGIFSGAALESRETVGFRPGQGGHVIFSAIYDTGEANTYQRGGAGVPGDNGAWFGYNQDVFGIWHSYNGFEDFYPQSAWNNDVMDGSGSVDNDSGMLLDPTKGNIYKIQFAGTAFGSISFSISEPVTGKFYTVHRISFANTASEPSLEFPRLNMSFYADNDDIGSAKTMKVGSIAGFNEGKDQLLGPTNSFSNSKTGVGTTLTPIFSIRNKSTFAGKTNIIPLRVTEFSLSVDGAKPALVEIILNGTLAGTPSWTDIDTATSPVEADTAATGISGGIRVGTFSVAKDGNLNFDLTEQRVSITPGDVVTVAVRATSTSTDAASSLIWVERY